MTDAIIAWNASLPALDQLSAMLDRLSKRSEELIAKGLLHRSDDVIVGPIKRYEMWRHKHLVSNLRLLGYERVDDYWIYRTTGAAIHPLQLMNAWKHWSNSQILACVSHVRRHPHLAAALWAA